MLHAKTIVIDGAVAIVGSANVDIRSFRYNFELGTVVADERVAGPLEGRFLADLEESREVLFGEIRRTPFLTRIGRGCARLLSPLL